MKRTMRKRLLSIFTVLLSACLGFLVFAGCNKKEEEPTPSPSGDPVYTVGLDQTALTIELTETATLVATLYKDGVATDESWAADWRSSDESVVTVSNGTLVAVTAGSASVTVSYGEKSASCSVTVQASYRPQIVIGAGEAQTLAVEAGGEYGLSPYIRYNGKTFTDGAFEYSSSNESIVTVSEDGTLTGVATGSAVVTVNGAWRGFTKEDGLSENFNVSVREDLSVSIDQTGATIAATEAYKTLGESYTLQNTVQLTATVKVDGNEVSAPALSWASSDPSVAAVDASSGLVTAAGEGVANITVSYTRGEDTHTSVAVQITVEFPYLDKSDEISLTDVDASDAATDEGLCLRASDVQFGATPISAVLDVTDGASLSLYTRGEETGADAVITTVPTEGERVWEVRNELYAYKISVSVVTRIINDAADILAAFGSNRSSSPGGLVYGTGKIYILGGNIDASGTTMPGQYYSSLSASTNSGFCGSFDGRGYTIDSLTVICGGLFGDLGQTAVVKNFALTNLTYDKNSTRAWQTGALGYVISNGAQIENVFISVVAATSAAGEASTNFGLYGLAMGIGGTGGTTLTDVVVVFAPVFENNTLSNTASFLEKVQSTWYGAYEDVHIVSDNTFYLSGDVISDVSNEGLTRYGAGASYDSFSARYANAETAVTDAGLSEEYWVYSATLGYPVFKSYLETFYGEQVKAAFTAIDGSTVASFDEGESGSYALPSALGAVSVAPGGEYTGIAFENGAISVSASAAGGSYSFTITSTDVENLSATVYIRVYSEDEVAERNVRQAFAALAEEFQDTVEYNVGGNVSSVDLSDLFGLSDLGSVSLTFTDTDGTGVQFEESNSTLTFGDGVQAGKFTVTVTSDEYYREGSESEYLSVTVNFELLNETIAVSALAELSQDESDADNYSALAYDAITENGVAAFGYKAEGAAAYTAIAAENYTVSAGKIEISQTFLATLTAGAYSFRAQLSGSLVEFTNVMVYTNVITTADELMQVFGTHITPKSDADQIAIYGEGEYYVLGNNIDATGTTRSEDYWTNQASDGGFLGIFDGKGYTIDGLTVGNGGLFGNLGSSSVIKNFALTNLKLSTEKTWQPAAIAYYIYEGATIENVFIHITEMEMNNTTSSTFCVFANAIRYNYNTAAGNNYDFSTAVTIKNVVVYMDFGDSLVSGAKTASFTVSYAADKCAAITNVHVISDYYLFTSSDTIPTDINANYLSQDVTRYGLTSNTFASAYSPESGLTDELGLDSDYWTYESGMAYPVFTSALSYLA